MAHLHPPEAPERRVHPAAVIEDSASLGMNIAKNDDEAIKWLTAKGFTGKVAKSAVAKAIEEENGAGSLWQIVQGVTAHARSIVHRDVRTSLEKKAGSLLRLAA